MADRHSDSDVPAVDTLPHDPGGSGTTWIVVAAIVIGILTVLLVGTTVAVTRSGPPEAAEATPAATSASPTPEEEEPAAAEGSTNIECDGRFIVELARSTTASADAEVEQAAADQQGGKFLDAAASCSTYESEGVRRVAYIGPFDTLAAACDARVGTGNLTAVPRQMDAGQVGPDYCFCRKSAEARPVLQAGAGTDGDVATLMVIGDLQRVLKELGFFAPRIDGGPYGPRTISAVQAFQTDQNLFASGVTDQSTWAAVRRGEDGNGNAFC